MAKKHIPKDRQGVKLLPATHERALRLRLQKFGGADFAPPSKQESIDYLVKLGCDSVDAELAKTE